MASMTTVPFTVNVAPLRTEAAHLERLAKDAERKAALWREHAQACRLKADIIEKGYDPQLHKDDPLWGFCSYPGCQCWHVSTAHGCEEWIEMDEHPYKRCAACGVRRKDH